MADETRTDTEQMIPKSRLDEVIRQRDEARSQVSSLEQQVSDMKGKVESYSALSQETEKLKAQLQERESSLESERGVWEQDKVLLKAGVHDDDVADLVKLKYGKQDEQDFSKFFESQRDKEYLKPFLGAGNNVSQTPPDGTETPDAGNSGADVTPDVAGASRGDPANAGNPMTPGAGSELDPMTVRNMNPDEFAANAQDIVKNLWPGGN